MPNWCENSLKVTGKKSEIEKMLEAIKGDEIPFDFEKILPTPGDMAEEQSPPINIHKGRYNTQKYGEIDWWHWRVENWKTKWNLDDSTIIDFNGKECNIYFNTAWSPPLGIITKLSEMFPELSFKLSYLEIGMCFAGVFEANAGEVEDCCVEESKDPVAYKEIIEEYFPDTAAMLDENEQTEE